MQKKLIRDCIRKKVSAQNNLFNLYNQKMFRVAYRYLKNKEDAQDVLIESFITVFENLVNFEIRNENSLENWIKTIVINNAIMLLRKKKKANFTDIGQNDSLMIQAEDDIYHEDLFQAVMNLPTGYRTVFNLFVIEGFSHKEIAEKLEISIQTSKSQYHRAKIKLREILKGFGYERKRI